MWSRSTMGSALSIPVTLKDHVVGPTDKHLNERAVDQLMRDLANKVSAEAIADIESTRSL